MNNVYILAREVPKLGQVAIGPFSNQGEIERLFESVDRSKFELGLAVMSPDQFVQRFGELFRVEKEGEKADGAKVEAKTEAKAEPKTKEPAHTGAHAGTHARK